MKHKAIIFNSKDNVATALEHLSTGESVEMVFDGKKLVVDIIEPVPFGHKFSLINIEANSPVIKYGETIGIATDRIKPGAYVHVHNVVSTRGRGDLPQVSVQ